MTKPRPTNITADRNKRELIIQWHDGRECHYPFAGLRAVCPCAQCQDGHANMGRPADKDLLYNSEDADINLDNIEQVGSYALSFLWSDGHWHGIYAWQYLYDACQQDM